jgi:hypothetical protein
VTGLLHFAEGGNEGPYTLFIDDIQYEKLPAGVVTNARASMGQAAQTKAIGETASVIGLNATYAIQDVGAAVATDVTCAPTGPGYFDFVTSNSAVATVENGVATIVGVGSAEITATLNGDVVGGVLTVTGTGAAASPTDLPPVPTFAQSDVIALYSSAYTDVPVDTLLAGFSAADMAPFAIPGTSTEVLRYTLRNFAGIEFFTPQLDLTSAGMTHFSMTVWTSDVDTLLVKVVDFNGVGVASGFNHETNNTVAITVSDQWFVIDIDLTADPAFLGDFVSQVILDGNSAVGNTLYVDHMIFHR